jgi:hypothetical protein
MIAVYHPPGRPDVCFEVLDSGESRADLKTRKELKFTLPRADVQKLCRVLEGNGRRQIHNNEVSIVHSVYFDDARLSTCRANLDGLGRRNKVRIRWYDSPRPAHEFFFEIKWRDNRVTGKHRLQVRSSQSLEKLSYRTIVEKLSAALPDHCQSMLARYCEPTVLVRYQREHFTAVNGPLRATIDYNICYFDQTGKQFISSSFGHRHEGLVVLEGKMPVGRESELRAMLHPLGARLDRCSKYVHGCQLLGLVRV